eukprot:1137598-Amorphochlora_amoeboformis.AAC.1
MAAQDGLTVVGTAKSIDDTLTARLHRNGRLVLCDGDSGAMLMTTELGSKIGERASGIDFSKTTYELLIYNGNKKPIAFDLEDRCLRIPVESLEGSSGKNEGANSPEAKKVEVKSTGPSHVASEANLGKEEREKLEKFLAEIKQAGSVSPTFGSYINYTQSQPEPSR